MEEQIFGEILSANPYIQQGWITLRIQKMIEDGKILIVKDNRYPARRMISKGFANNAG